MRIQLNVQQFFTADPRVLESVSSPLSPPVNRRHGGGGPLCHWPVYDLVSKEVGSEVEFCY